MDDITNVVNSENLQPSENSEQLQSQPQPAASPLPAQPEIPVKIKKPIKHLRKLILLSLILGVVIIGNLVSALMQGRQQEVRQNPTFTVKETTESQEPVVDLNLTTLNLSEYGFTITYPKELEIQKSNPFDPDPLNYRFIYKGARQTTPITKEDTLQDGYIFKIVINMNPINKDLMAIAKGKRDNYLFNCTSLTETSEPKATDVNGLPATVFTVQNCNNDYVEYFVLNKDYLYEIVQIYKGDLGYKQKYEKDTNELLQKIAFDRDPPPPEAPFVEYSSFIHAFSLRHPHLSQNCCDIPAPVYGSFIKIVSFADTQLNNSTQGKALDGFAVYVYANDDPKAIVAFTDFVEKEKVALIDNYKIIVGKAPEPSSKDIKVGDVPAVLLKGHAWWGDVVMLQIPNSNAIMFISKTDYIPGSFDDVFSGILSTFTFRAQ